LKFIHTSDWHLGRQFHSVSLLDDQRHVLDQILQYIKEESVDAVIIAGDIYDRSIPPATAVDLLDDILNKICTEQNIPVIIIPGNHDSADRLGFAARQLKPAGLHIISDFDQMIEPVIIKVGGNEVNFFGIPFNDPESVRNHYSAEISSYDDAHKYLVEQIDAVKSDKALNVVISHCFIDGAAESESERPLSIGGSDRVNYDHFKGFDYVALGHLHSPQYKGEKHIRYSGSILKYSFSERNQKKGITLVEMDDSGLKQTTHIPLIPLRDMRIIEGELNKIVEQGKVDPNSDDYLLVRLTDRHAILDPMGKLRAVYPNVLHLEKPGMLQTGNQQMTKDKLKRGELEMFKDFFVEVYGQKMTADQDEGIKTIISQIRKTEKDAQ
jgi:exonuclease SbcD